MVDNSLNTTLATESKEEEEEEKAPEPLKALPGEAEVKLTSLDYKLKSTLEDR